MSPTRSSQEFPEILLFRADIRYEQDVVLVRQRARQLAGLLGFDNQEQTRLATSVSEIARNAYEYAGGGRVAFLVSGTFPQMLMIRISDDGRGIADLNAILEGRYDSPSGMGVGLAGARRLVDFFDIKSAPGQGTTVTLGKTLPASTEPITPTRVASLAAALTASQPRDILSELQSQNHELLRALDHLRARQAEVERLNAELAETNRGVLALYAELDDRALQLARASELKSNFLSNISHELRTPLNAIHNLARLLIDRTDGELTPDQNHQVVMIRRAATALTEMVNDLLDLAKIEAGKTVLRVTEFSVLELMGSLRGIMRPLLTADSVALVFDSPPADFTLQSDEGKVSQVLRNLVSNAVKFTEHGEIRVSARLEPASDTVEFTVSDSGIGIPPEDLERIFEDYTQLENSLQKRAVGTGLGLPLSRRLANLLGGTLTVTSRLGHGSLFTLSLPRVLPASPAAESHSASPASYASGSPTVQHA
jgi:signal transduction histidine kinase